MSIKRARTAKARASKKRAIDKPVLKTSWRDLESSDAETPALTSDKAEALPIVINGKVIKVSRPDDDNKSENRESANEDTATDSEEMHQTDGDDEQGVESDARVEALSAKDFREMVAQYAELITMDPEDNLDKVQELQRIATRTPRASRRSILVLSLLTIYKDIIPGYRIRPLTERQMKENVSKEIRQLREYEGRLLNLYREYISSLVVFYRQGHLETEGGKYAVACSVVYAACDLLNSKPHFNLRKELASILVSKLGSLRIDQTYLMCIETITTLFENDEEGGISFDIVNRIAKMVKNKRYKIDSRVLGTFIHLRLLTELQGRADLDKLVKEKPQVEKIPKKQRVYLSKERRQARRERKEIEEEMRKADMVVSAEVRERNQAQTLKTVFVLYFNILKHRSKRLMGVTLEGLAKFSNLINAELFRDLLEVLREIIVEQGDHITTRISLLCIITAFALLAGQPGDALSNTDLSFFIQHFYSVLYVMALTPSIETSHKSLRSMHEGKVESETDLLVRCFESMFVRQRATCRSRVLAFSKRLATCALQFPERTMLVALNVLSAMVDRHSYVRALFHTHDRVKCGTYNYETDNPDECRPEVATIWETTILRSHFNPRIVEAARKLGNTRE